MVSDILTPTWRRLVDKDEKACMLFQVGKNWDGYFTADSLITQINNVIDIFRGKVKGWATELWMFNNAPSHQKQAPNALSARYMSKNTSETWMPKRTAVIMCPGSFADRKFVAILF